MFDRMLVHRATISPRESAGPSRFGQPANTFKVKYSDVPCRISRANGSTARTDTLQGTVTADYVVYFKDDVVLTEDDLISVADSKGNEIANSLQVIIVRRVSDGTGLKHHVEAPCRLWRGMNGVG